MISEQRIDRVDDRLHALESAVVRLTAENRRYRRAGVAAFLLAASGLGMAQATRPTADEVRAQRFVLVDARGQARGSLISAPDGTSLLSLNDASQRAGVAVGVTASGASELTLYDGRGRRRLSAAVDTANTASLTLTNAGATAASVSLSVAGNGTPVIRLSDAAGAPRLLAGVVGDEVSLSLMGRQSRLGTVLAVDGETSRLALADGSGTERLWVAIRKDSPVLQFFDQKRVARSGIITINDDSGLAVVSQSPGAAVPGLVLYGKGMKVLWAAPDR